VDSRLSFISSPFGVGCRLSGLKGNETRMNASSETCPHLVVETQPAGACSPRCRAKRHRRRQAARAREVRELLEAALKRLEDSP